MRTEVVDGTSRRVQRAVLVACLTLSAAAGCRTATGADGGGAGQVLWRVPSNSRAGAFPFEPALNAAGDRVYFPTADFRLKKVDAADGRVLWDVDLGPVFTIFSGWNATLSGPNVIVTKADLFAFDTTTGAPRWTFQLPGDDIGYSTTASDSTRVYAASRLGRVVAVDAVTGAAAWTVDLSSGSADVGALFPTLDRGLLYVCTRNTQTVPLRGTLWALDALTGATRWRHDFQPELPDQPASCFGGAAVVGDVVVQPEADGRVFAFDRLTGAVRWTAPRVHAYPAYPGGPGSLGDQRWVAARGSTVIVTSTTGTVVSLDPATGAQRWRSMPLGAGALDGRLTLSDESVYLSGGAYYGAADLATGALRWRDPATDSYTGDGTQYHGRAIVTQDRVFIGGRDASYALRR